MADQTIASNKFHSKIAFDGMLDRLAEFREIFKVNGTNISAGLIVTQTGQSNYDVRLIGTGEEVAGVVLDYANEAQYKENYSLGVTIGDNKEIHVLNPKLSRQRMKCQLVVGRSTTTAAATIAKNTNMYAITGGKITNTYPGASTAAKTFVGVLGEQLDGGTADKVVGVWV